MYCLLSCMNSAMWNTFAPISDDSEVYFGVSATWINFLAVVWSVIYGPGTVLGIYWFQKYELRSTLLLCASVTVIGSLLRYLAVSLRVSCGLGSTACYGLVLLGQVLIGIGQPIVCNLATGMASIWFPVEQRDRATTIGTVFNPLGNAIGSILPPLIVYSTAANAADANYTDIQGMDMLLLVQFLLALVVCFYNISITFLESSCIFVVGSFVSMLLVANPDRVTHSSPTRTHLHTRTHTRTHSRCS